MGIEENIAMVLRAAYLSMHRQTGAFLAKSGVTADQFVCLAILDDEDGITQQELAIRASSDPNTISAMLALLEKQNLVSRETHPADRRAQSVRLTARGRDVYQRLVNELAPVRERLLSAFDAQEQTRLLILLKRITRAMAAIPSAGAKDE